MAIPPLAVVRTFVKLTLLLSSMSVLMSHIVSVDFCFNHDHGAVASIHQNLGGGGQEVK